MIRISTPPKPRDRFGSIPIRDGKPMHTPQSELHLPRTPKTFFPWSWLRKIAGFFFVLMLLLGLSTPIVIPYLATTLLAEKISSALNRPVTIPRAEFNPLTCTLTLHQLIVGPDLSKPNDPVDPLLSVARMSINFGPKRMIDGELVCTLNAKHCFVHLVRRKDGAYNLGQAMNDLVPGMALLPLRLSCNTIAISNSRLVFDDEQTGKTHHAEEIDLNVSPRNNTPGQTSTFRLQATINDTAITLNDTAILTANPPQMPSLLPGMPDPATQGESGSDPGTTVNPAVKTAEAIALIHDLTQTARQYLQHPSNPPVTHRTGNTPSL